MQVCGRHIEYTYILGMPVAHICTYRNHVSAIDPRRPAGRCAGAKRYSASASCAARALIVCTLHHAHAQGMHVLIIVWAKQYEHHEY